MAEDFYASPCQNVFDERMKKTWQWNDWSDAQETWSSRDETMNESPPHAHIDHWSERSQWQDNVPWRQNHDRHDYNESQNACGPQRLYPRDERWG